MRKRIGIYENLQEESQLKEIQHTDAYHGMGATVAEKKSEKSPSERPPSGWFKSMTARLKAADPRYSDEQIKKTLGDIWFHKLSDEKKKEIRGREGKVFGKAHESKGEQYSSLNDAAKLYPSLAAGPVEIWYQKSFRGPDASMKDLSATHVKVGSVKETDLDKIYYMMQGEMWSPNGEARQLIKELGLSHTSMSRGDVICKNGQYFVVDFAGFKKLTEGVKIESLVFEWAYDFKDKKAQEEQLVAFVKDMMNSRIENDKNNFDYNPEFVGDTVEDQLTGLRGEVNGKEVKDVYLELTKGMSDKEIAKATEDIDGLVEISGGWAYYDGHYYKKAVGGKKEEAIQGFQIEGKDLDSRSDEEIYKMYDEMSNDQLKDMLKAAYDMQKQMVKAHGKDAHETPSWKDAGRHARIIKKVMKDGGLHEGKSEKWVIRDWAGNYPFEKYIRSQGGVQLGGGPSKTFKSFDDAEDFLANKLGDKYDEERGEYEIELIESIIKEDPDDIEHDDFEPEEDDIFFTSVGSLGSKTQVSAGGKVIGTFVEFEDAEKAAKEWCKKNNFWPNAWNVSDHGNYHLMSDFHKGESVMESDLIPQTWEEYEEEVVKLEAEGLSTSDAQGVVDARLMVNGIDPTTLKKKESVVESACSDAVEIKSVAEFDEQLKSPVAWPGLYPKYFVTADNGVLSYDAAKKNASLIRDAIADKGSDKQWEVKFAAVNYENDDLYCDHTGKKIPSAYGENESVVESAAKELSEKIGKFEKKMEAIAGAIQPIFATPLVSTLAPEDDKQAKEIAKQQKEKDKEHEKSLADVEQLYKANEKAGEAMKKEVEKAMSKSIKESSGDKHPAVYVGTYGKYNGGSLKGKWMNLDDYADKEEFLKAAFELHKDEEDPELMYQDYENFPEKYYSESGIDEKLWDWIALDDEDKEILEAYIDLTGDADADIDDAKEKYQGKYDSKEDWAHQFLDEVGIGEKTAEQYITVDDVTARQIGLEDADSLASDMLYDLKKENFDEVFERAGHQEDEYEKLKEELEAAEEKEDGEDEVEAIKEKIVKLAEKAIDEFQYSHADEVEEAIKKDAVGYFCDEQGIYTPEELAKQSFVSFDYEAYVRDCELSGDVDFVKVGHEYLVFWGH